jgi:translation initiation factor 3 subunit M
MAQFVGLSEDDPCYELVALINRLNGAESAPQTEGDEDEEDPEVTAAKASPLGKLITNKKYLEFLEKGFFKNVDKLSASADDLEPAYNLVFSLLGHLTAKGQDSVVSKLSLTLAQDNTKDTQLRLSLLATLFNVFVSQPSLRFSLFLQILDYALETSNQTLLEGQLGKVDEWVEEWQLKGKQRADVYGSCYKVVGGKGPLAQHFLYQHLQAADKSAFKMSGELVNAAVVEAVRNGELARMDQLSRLPVVAAQRDSKVGSAAYECLQVFTSGNIAAFTTFANSNSAFLKENNLDEQKLTSDIRTLTLCTLGMEHTRLSYAKLMEELQLADHDAVEEAVIEAVTSGLLDAQIDQENGEVIIRRSTERQFHDKEWDSITTKLDAWKLAINRTLTVLAERGGALQV